MIYSVIADPVGKSRFAYWCQEERSVCGISHQPLLDACRQLKRMGADPVSPVRLCHERTWPDYQWTLQTTVGKGAELTVFDPPGGGGPKFRQFRQFPANPDNAQS